MPIIKELSESNYEKIKELEKRIELLENKIELLANSHCHIQPHDIGLEGQKIDEQEFLSQMGEMIEYLKKRNEEENKQ
jgi:hypothetical protein